MNIKVSVVMPVLNGMPYFKEALESVMNQTLTDIEIIIVDCGSNDGTLEYIDECMKKDNRIKLLNSDKKSMGYQYNMGISYATGEYIGFCESDDMLDLDAYKYMYNIASENNKTDCVKSTFKMFIEKPKKFEIEYDNIPRENENLHNQVITTKTLPVLIYRDVNMWNGIYKRTFILENNIVLNETKGAAFQDTGFVQRVHAKSNSTIYGTKPVYYYRRDNEGSSVYKSTVGLFALNEFYYTMKLLNESSVIRENFLRELFGRAFGLFFRMYSKDLYYKTSNQYSDEVKELREKLIDFYNKLSKHEQTMLYDNIPLFTMFKSLSDFETVCISNYESIAKKYNAFWDIFKDSSSVVVFGCGEFGQGIAAAMFKNDFEGEVCYCDNKIKASTYVCGVNAYSVAEAVKKYPNAYYLITGTKYFAEMRSQLYGLGVKAEKIICAPTIGMHASMELKFE